MTTEMNFAGLGLAEPLLRAVADAGYTIPTPVQAKAIPIVLAGEDLLAAAQTGTGKTAGFVLPILQRLSNGAENVNGARPGRPRCLILTPTRELAAQVEESVRIYGKYVPLKSMVMFGGVGIQPQVTQLRKRIDILVATPGRLLDHAGQRTLDLSGVEILVLDEGDRMLDMGFIPDVKRILALMPKQRQNMLFSATFSSEIRALAANLLNKPGCIDIAPRNTASELVEQSVHLVGKNEKRDLLSHLIRHNAWQQVLVFTRTKHGANRLTEKLQKDGIAAVAIHGNKSQAARTRALADFKRGEVSVLVATDIAARGLDIEELPHVVNFELPHVAEDYVHRIGRTGRAGVSGAAVSLVDAEEIQLLRAIEKLINRPIERVVVEGFVPSPRSSERDDERPREPRQQRHQHKRSTQQPQRQPRGHASEAPRHAPRASEPRDDNWGNRVHAVAPEAARGNHRHHSAPRLADNNRIRVQPRGDVQGDRQPAAVSIQQEAAVSEAARHQAQPQPALFSPRPGPQRRRG